MFWGRKGRQEDDAETPALTPDQEAEVQEVLHEAHRFGDEGDWNGMAEHLRGALETFPGEPRVLCWLGVAERELGLETIAYDRFKQCLAAQPTDPHVLATAGNAVAAFDDPDAEVALRTAAVTAPDLALARWLYGAYLTREGFVREGLDELQAARALEPDNPEIVFELGVALALQGNHEGAVDELFRAGELDPGDGWTKTVLGLALVEEDRLDEALGELTAGARLRPDDVEAQLLAALAAGSQGYDDLAWEMLERARQSGAGAELVLAGEVEDRLEQGVEETRSFLERQLAPSAYRDRLRTRP